MNLNIQIRTADAKRFQREFYPAHVSRRRRTATEYIKTPLLVFVRYLLSLLRHQGPSILCLDVRQKQMQGTCKLGALKASRVHRSRANCGDERVNRSVHVVSVKASFI